MEDREPTFEEIEEMAEGGSVPACAYIGNAYYYGWICEQDLEKALKYLTVAANGCVPLSQFTLGFMYSTGRGVEHPDLEEASKWFLAAGFQGVPEAMYDAGQILMKIGDKSTKERGKEWVRRAKEAGYPD
ncbi:MAG: sel1 repeat family protein [Lachnospiraceae bacterium]|nr:sel1 repeat family protein [Lachnospiraceae bacterium]